MAKLKGSARGVKVCWNSLGTEAQADTIFALCLSLASAACPIPMLFCSHAKPGKSTHPSAACPHSPALKNLVGPLALAQCCPIMPPCKTHLAGSFQPGTLIPAWHSPMASKLAGVHIPPRECPLIAWLWPGVLVFLGPTELRSSKNQFLESYHVQGIAQTSD